MKKAKKMYALLAMLVLIFALAACGGGDDETGTGTGVGTGDAAANGTDTGTPGADTGTAATPQELRAVIIEYHMIGSPQSAEGTARINAALNEYLASIGRPYTVRLIHRDWGEWSDGSIAFDLSVGPPINETAIDVMFIANWAGDFFATANMGHLRPLNDFLTRFPEIERLLTADFMNATQVNGRNYALPVNKEKARQHGWMVRADIAEAMGMDIASINNLDDLEPYIYRAFQEHGMVSLSWGIETAVQHDTIVQPHIGVGTEPGSSTVRSNDLEPITRETVQRLARWYSDGIISSEIHNTFVADFNGAIATGNVFGGAQQLPPGIDGSASATTGFPMVSVPFNQPEIANSETSGAMIAIPAHSQNPEEAFDFIRLLYSDATLLNLIIFGQEGIDFEYVDQAGGIVRTIDSDWNNSSSSWTMGDMFMNYLTEFHPPDLWEQFIAFNEAGRPLPSLGFIPDLSDEDLQRRLAALTSARQQYDILLSGFIAEDEIDAMFEAMRTEYEIAGLNYVLEELQSQFDAWLAGR